MTSAKLKFPESKTQRLLEVAQLAAAGIPLNNEQAADYLQLAPATLPVWRAQGKGPKFVLVGTRPRYLKVDLDEWIASSKTKKRVSPNVGRPVGAKSRRRKVA